jgi:hypothetical protein
MIHKSGNPILVTGSHRSGTTFLGKMLSLHSSIGYIFEPFNFAHGMKGIDYEFTYVYKGMQDEEKYIGLVQDILNGKVTFKTENYELKNKITMLLKKVLLNNKHVNYFYKRYISCPLVDRILIKDPMACLSSEWLHQTFNMDVVVLIRHPAAFVGSLKRLGWRFDWNHFTNQTELMNKYFNVYLENVELNNLSIVDEGIILWNCIYSVLTEYLNRNPNMIFIRHEDLSVDPVVQLNKLYDKLGIPFTKKIEENILEFTNDKNPTDPKNNEVHTLKRNSKNNIKRWKKILTEGEIQKIKIGTIDVAQNYYSEIDW